MATQSTAVSEIIADKGILERQIRQALAEFQEKHKGVYPEVEVSQRYSHMSDGGVKHLSTTVEIKIQL